MLSSDTQTSLSNSSHKRKKSDQDNSPFKAIGIQSENPLLRRPPFRSGRVQEEAQKFLSIPEENKKNTKREDHSAQLTNTSSISNLSSKSKKSKSKKSSISQHSSKSRAKSKTSSTDNSSNNNNSLFDSSKLLRQPAQSKNFNLDFDSRWEYFLELKTLDDATKRIYNSAFFQLWKTIYQKRYMRKAEEQASQIESMLDRFTSSHLYKNKNTNSFSNSYNTSRQNSSYEIDSRINRRSGLSNGYSFNSFQDTSEARVERMQQKYRKNYSNFDYANNNVNDKSFRTYSTINNDSYLNENNINDKSDNIYNNRSFNDMKEYYDKFISNTNKNSYNDRVYNNNYEYTNNADFNYRNINYNNNINESFRSNSIKNNSFNSYRNNDRNINDHLHDENRFDFDYLKSSNSPMKVAASDSIKPASNAQIDTPKIKKEEIIHQSRSYDPSISRELIEEIEGRISGQNEKEIALHFASQLNTIAKFNNTLNEYNKNRRNSIIEEEEEYEETQNNSLEIEKLDKNERNQTQIKQINTNNNNNEINQEETDFNNLNNSNDFIKIPENQTEPNNQFNENQIQQSTQKKIIFANTLQKENDSQNINMINENYTNNQNRENKDDIFFGDQYQKKKVVDKYDKYIEKITNSSSVNDEDDDDDDLLKYLKAQRQNFQSNSKKIRISNSEYQPVSRPNFISNNNYSKSTVTLEKLLKQNEIQVDTNLNNDNIRQANASRIQSVLSKTTIGFNNVDSDSDSDQIDLSGVQFYHVSQAENAKFSNSNPSEIRQSMSANVVNKKLSNLEQYETIQNEKEEEENNESDLSPVPRRKREKSKKNSQKLTQELSNYATKGMQENDDITNETDLKSSFNSKRNTISRSSSRRKRSATISGISPILKKNMDQNKQENEYNKSINRQQIKQIDDNEYNSYDEKLSEFNISKRNKQENKLKNSQKQQTNQINNSQNRYRIDQTNESNKLSINKQINQNKSIENGQANENNKLNKNKLTNQIEMIENDQTNESNKLSKNKQTNQIKSIENDQTNVSNRLSKNKQTNQIKSIENDQTNEFSIKNGGQFDSSLSASNKKTYTSSELTEISKRNLISREENYSESENETYQRKRTRISDSLYFDDQQIFKEKDFNQPNSAENNKRAELSSLYDEEEFKKMEKNSHFYIPLLKTFPGDLYDDVFTTGSERRNEYLSKTKLASIINFFSLKENEENKAD